MVAPEMLGKQPRGASLQHIPDRLISEHGSEAKIIEKARDLKSKT